MPSSNEDKQLKNIQGIPYTIRTSARTRRILITIEPDGAVVVSKPMRVSIEKIERLLQEKIEWIKETVNKQKSRPQKLLAHYSVKDFKHYKEQARKLAVNRLTHFNAFYKHPIGKVYIRNQKSRWGSCSGKGNLNFNYKIVLLPPDLADYIIVHELCHLKQMNHSQNFWALVEQQIPDYKQRQKQIRSY
jgi:predicted metal-dependent hydrolase